MLNLAVQQAKAAGQTVGQWLEEAILEKLKREKAMSLRQIAKELGVSHTLSVLWRQGKRSLAPDLKAR